MHHPGENGIRLRTVANTHWGCARSYIQRGPVERKGRMKRDCWVLEYLMDRAGVFPAVKEKLLAAGVDVKHWLAWELFCFSQKNTSNYSVRAYPAKMLGQDPAPPPGVGFERSGRPSPKHYPTVYQCYKDHPVRLGESRTGLPYWDELDGQCELTSRN